MRRLGVFGGTFDPVHLGHIGPALLTQATFEFDALLFVPAARPPHKQGEVVSAFSHRRAMLALATRPYERFLVSDVELEGSGPTYTIETIERLAARFPAEHTYFIMGSDSFAQIATWHRWQELVARVNLIVLHRPTVWRETLLACVPPELLPRLVTVTAGSAVPDPAAGECRIYLLEHEPSPISATAIRACVRRGVGIDELVGAEVRRYIVENRLYRQEEETNDVA